ncbi:cytochrome P450 [Parasulfitobacter algicola]|uniref:Cytochrome P450 n=1 Tax=Parasulfitobacter algicola TaxID=2614809 RepID=A0ABX2IZ51_9RHOB|nr:cytochrome P450 [Sulfitobacter algicola]NSX55888.1 cytochrome P450 [Sulfitobacter algicola]
MQSLSQSPSDPDFVQNPYDFYNRARQTGPIFFWQEYDIPCILSYAMVSAVLRDKRFGRETPDDKRVRHPGHQAAFWAVEDHSMLELEPPRHTRLRTLVLRAFTSRRVTALRPDIEALANNLIDRIETSTFDLIHAFAQPLPVIIIARLLGLPDEDADQLLGWSNAMVGMYQANRTHKTEVTAAQAAQAFSDYLQQHIKYRQKHPGDDLITHLINAQDQDDQLTLAEITSTCILLLNAGHEATVHTTGNGVKALLDHNLQIIPDNTQATVEEILRYDPPLHMFTRWAYENVELGRHTIAKGTKVGLLLGAANRDPDRWDASDRFDPDRPQAVNTSFGAGLHFCLGAPLARLELQTALPILFDRFPNLQFEKQPEYANIYHFHGLKNLWLTR